MPARAQSSSFSPVSPLMPTAPTAWVTTSKVTVVAFYDRTGLIYETLGTLNEAIKTNKELHAQRDLFDEMGQNLDIQVADQIVEIDNQRIELQGSASEQYYQLRSRLKDIYEMEATPMTAL